MTCTACERAGTKDCVRVFRCHVCLERKRVCSCQVGGFDDPRRICANCHYQLHTGKTLVNKYTNHRLLRKRREEMHESW